MKDVHEIIRDVMLPEKQVPTMRVGLEAAAAIIAALNVEGYVIVPATMVVTQRVPFNSARK